MGEIFKRVVADGTNYEEYEDGSVRVICQHCFKEEFFDSETAKERRRKGVNFAHYTCYDCWRKFTNAEKMSDIILGQAFNKMIDTLLEFAGSSPEKFDKLFDEYADKYFKKYISFLSDKRQERGRNSPNLTNGEF